MNSIFVIFTRLKFYFIFKFNVYVLPTRKEFLRLHQAVQLDWIARQNKDYEDMLFSRNVFVGISYPEQLIRLDDYLKDPVTSDVAGILRYRDITVSPNRELEINAGKPLTSEETAALTDEVADCDMDNWITHHCYDFLLKDGFLYAHFESYRSETGGRKFIFHSLFHDRYSLLDYIDAKPISSLDVQAY